MEHEYNGIGVASCPIYLKADVLESCARFSPFRGVCPVVEQTELGLLCLGTSTLCHSYDLLCFLALLQLYTYYAQNYANLCYMCNSKLS